jgi:LysM repeat protein
LQEIATMGSWKRLLFYLLLNVLVSAVTVLTVLYIWERNQAPNGAGLNLPQPFANVPTSSSQSGGTGGAPADSGNMVHTVQFGDTLDSIAQLYGVTLEALMEANEISDPAAIGVGQALAIPANTNGSNPSASTGEAPVYSSSNPQLEIFSVVGAGDLPTERVVIRHVGEQQIPMAGWKLRSSDGDEYSFPALILYKGGTVNVHTAAGVDSVGDLYWGRAGAVWLPGNGVVLLDPQGNEHVVFTIP